MEFEDEEEIKNEDNKPDERIARQVLFLFQQQQKSQQNTLSYQKYQKKARDNIQKHQLNIQQFQLNIQQEQTRINQHLQQQLDDANSTIQQLQQQVDDANSRIQQLIDDANLTKVQQEKSKLGVEVERNDYRMRYDHLLDAWTKVSIEEKYNVLLRHLNGENGTLMIREVEGDGNCLFRAVSLQLDKMDHKVLRQSCYNYCVERKQTFQEWFQDILTKQEFDDMLNDMENDGTYSDILELCVLESFTKKRIYYYRIQDTAFARKAIEVPSKEECDSGEIILVYSEHDYSNRLLNHYDAIINTPPQRKRARRK